MVLATTANTYLITGIKDLTQNVEILAPPTFGVSISDNKKYIAMAEMQIHIFIDCNYQGTENMYLNTNSS